MDTQSMNIGQLAEAKPRRGLWLGFILAASATFTLCAPVLGMGIAFPGLLSVVIGVLLVLGCVWFLFCEGWSFSLRRFLCVIAILAVAVLPLSIESRSYLSQLRLERLGWQIEPFAKGARKSFSLRMTGNFSSENTQAARPYLQGLNGILSISVGGVTLVNGKVVPLGTTFDDRSLEQFRDVNRIRSLNLTGTAVTGDGLKSIAKLDLQTLVLDSTGFSDVDCDALLAFQDLEKLWLQDTQITDEAIEVISTLPNIRDLSLSHARITDDSIKNFKKMTSLESLWLGGTEVTDEGMAELRAAYPNAEIDK